MTCKCIIIDDTPLLIIKGCLTHDDDIELCEICESNPKDGGRLCDSCRDEWKDSEVDRMEEDEDES